MTEKVVGSSPTNLKDSQASLIIPGVPSSWQRNHLTHASSSSKRTTKTLPGYPTLQGYQTDCDKRNCWCTIDEVRPEWLWRQPLRTNKTLRGYPPPPLWNVKQLCDKRRRWCIIDEVSSEWLWRWWWLLWLRLVDELCHLSWSVTTWCGRANQLRMNMT